ncbi:MAG: hypothetical protein AAF587_14415 [Bacteroidota bacterium]
MRLTFASIGTLCFFALFAGSSCTPDNACEDQHILIDALKHENNQYEHSIEQNREILTVIGSLMDSLEQISGDNLRTNPNGSLLDRIKAGQEYLDRTKAKVQELEEQIAKKPKGAKDENTEELQNLIAALKNELARKETEILALRAENDQLTLNNAELNLLVGYIQDSLSAQQGEKDSLRQGLQELAAQQQELSKELSETKRELNSKYFQLGQVERDLANRYSKILKRKKRIAHLEKALGFFQIASNLGHLNARREIVLVKEEITKLKK